MTLVAALVGLLIGNLLNVIVLRQASADDPTLSRRRSTAVDWLPVAGVLGGRDWVGLAVEVVTAVMAAALAHRYGLSLRGLFLFAASLILIDIGAVDFRVRMIDPLVLLAAMLVALALAPFNDLARLWSMIGLLTAAGIFIFFFVLAKLMFPGHAAPFGLGDVYLAAFIGALVGFFNLPPALFYGMLLAGLVSAALLVWRAFGRPTPTYIAYGTYLCLGALLFLAAGRY